MILKSTRLFCELQKHVRRFKSAYFLCTQETAFESWFRVELFTVLCKMGIPKEKITPTYSYQSCQSKRKKKADLLVCHNDWKIIFELKSFVKKQDSSKRESFPNQIKLMAQELQANLVDQIIALATFVGYGEIAMDNWKLRLEKWIREANLQKKGIQGQQIGPEKLIRKYKLSIWIGEYHRIPEDRVYL